MTTMARKGARLIRSEREQKIPAGSPSGRFEARKKADKMARGNFRVDQPEQSDIATPRAGAQRQRFKLRSYTVPKQPDKYWDDHHTKKRKIETARELGMVPWRDGTGSEIKSVDEMRKERQAKQKRSEKSTGAERRL